MKVGIPYILGPSTPIEATAWRYKFSYTKSWVQAQSSFQTIHERKGSLVIKQQSSIFVKSS